MPSQNIMGLTAGLILAGGQATRLGGGAKGVVLLRGRPMAAYARDNLAASLTNIGLNTRSDLVQFYTGLGMEIVQDEPSFDQRGPLAGVLAGLDWAQSLGASYLLTVPCDAPFLPANLSESLLCALSDPYEAAIAVTPTNEHPLCAAWRADLAPRLRTYLSAPNVRLAAKAFLAELQTAKVSFENEADFLNVNTPEDLAAAQFRLV